MSEDEKQDPPAPTGEPAFEYEFFTPAFTELTYQFFDGTVAGQSHSPDAGPGAQSFVPPPTATESGVAAMRQGFGIASTRAHEIREIKDHYGAVLTYDLHGLLPKSIAYADGTRADFEIDSQQHVVWFKEKTGDQWRRDSLPGEKGFSRWVGSDGACIEMAVGLSADGTYQRIFADGTVYTYTTAGKKLVSRPFKPDFDVKQAIFNVFRRIDRDGDGLVNKDDIDNGVLLPWINDDEAQLLAMLKIYFDRIRFSRKDALLKVFSGISAKDVLEFDAETTEAQLKHREPPEHAIQEAKDLFDRLARGFPVISIKDLASALNSEETIARDKQLIALLLDNMHRAHGFNKLGFVDRSERLTREDLAKLFVNVYREEIGSRIMVGGWGLEQTWESTKKANRNLYADPNNPLASVKLEAIKQGNVGNCLFLAALGSVVSACPQIILRTIEDNGNDTYTVTFAGAPDEPITVEAPSDIELALFARGSEFGIWAPVIEKAYGVYLQRHGVANNIIPTENSDGGAANMQSLDLLTGQTGEWIFLKHVSLSDLTQMIDLAFRQRRAVAAGASGWDRLREADGVKIVVRHAYSVIGWRHDALKVKLRNPWGIISGADSSNSNPTATADDGTNGIFELKLRSFKEAFQCLYLEKWRQ